MQHTGAALQAMVNTNLAYGAESPVHALKPTSAGFHDVMGNLWQVCCWRVAAAVLCPCGCVQTLCIHQSRCVDAQWCEDRLAALPNSRGVHPLYDDFSTPCYDGEHHIIMGGSFVSTGDESSVFARFHFRPHFFQQAGFRVVSSSGTMAILSFFSPQQKSRQQFVLTLFGPISHTKSRSTDDGLNSVLHGSDIVSAHHTASCLFSQAPC